MIPTRLALRNFMCYRDNVPPLDFTSVRVACLAGENGHGKSAILDAITWALWGRARAKSDDELIHLGRTEMEVEFEFLLGGQQYRVVRKRSKPKSEKGAGQTVVELHLLTDGEYRPITGNSVRETERKIVEILRMEYETFINSVFLLQGRADEFTTKTPSERKQVLAAILGLSFYDDLERRARDRAKELADEHRALQSELQTIERELEQKDAYAADLERIQAEVARLEQGVSEQEMRLAALRSNREVLDLKRRLLAEAEERWGEANRTLAAIAPRITEQRRQIAAAESLLEGADEIRAGYARLVEHRARHDALGQLQARQSVLKDRRHRLQIAIERARHDLTQRLQMVEAEVRASQELVDARPRLTAEVERVKAQLNDCAQLEIQNAEARKREHDLAAQADALKKENTQLKGEMAELKEKIDFLHKGDVVCPLCETELGHEGLHRIEAKYRSEGTVRADRYRENERAIRDFVRQQEEVHRQLVADETRLGQTRPALQRRAGVLEQQLEQAGQAEERLVRLDADCRELQSQIESGVYAAAEQRELEAVERNLVALAFDEAEFAEVRRAIVEHAPFEERYRRLSGAEESVGAARGLLANLEEQERRARATQTSEEGRRQELAAELKGLPELGPQLAEAERDYEQAARQISQARLREGALRQLLDTCAKQERRRGELTGEIRQKAEERAIYEELALAFSKKGVQAMIIENALPEIEVAANEILGRMTDNRMHVAIETQRDTRKGDTVETLDIRIADELGTRDYALFSGGEAYRVNFALRVALAKVLARRAGAQLQTLVVDEGFGTQDAFGRERLIEAITSIQDKFDKILVVTHIEELKEMFPSRIEVVKTPEGSTIQVV